MARKDHVNVALIGQGFMGRSHSNAWSQVNKFFSPPLRAVLHTSCGLPQEKPETFAARWGWQNAASDWKKVIANPEIDLVDIVSPNYMHYGMAAEALKAGKAVACEKPLSRTLDEARKLAAMVKKSKARTYVWYNYRRCPAVALAHQLVKAGKVGQIRHVRAVYLQDWASEAVPLIWRFDKKLAGSGSLGDLCAHIIDMTRFVTGEEITDVCGAITETFIKERKLMSGVTAGGIAAGIKGAQRKGRVTVDDAVLFLARFSGGAVASFEAARQATGNFNRNGFEINGTKGSLRFNFERMNELEFYDTTVDRTVQGWTTLLCTHGGNHPYVDAWWPDAHVLGYEHGFVNMAYDVLRDLAGVKPIVPLPTFAEAYATDRVLEAAQISAKRCGWVKLAAVK